MGKKIAIFAGHGGSDPGAVCGSRREKDYTLDVSKEVTRLLQAAGHTVTNNRTTDATRDIGADANKANAAGVDAVIEIHLNSNAGTPGTGTETYCEIKGGTSRTLAEAIQKRIVALGFKDRGVKTKKIETGAAAGQDYFGIIRQTKAPAVLIETAFINNDADMKLYNVDAVAGAIANGVIDVFGAEQPAPASASSIYKVVKGDTLSEIGAKLGVPWVEIANANGIKDPYTIYPDQVLKIPDGGSGGALKVGDAVRITGSKYATGETIPARVKAATHKVSQIKPDRVLLGHPDGINSWVYAKDVVRA